MCVKGFSAIRLKSDTELAAVFLPIVQRGSVNVSLDLYLRCSGIMTLRNICPGKRLSRTGHLYVKTVGDDDVWDIVHPVIPRNFAVPIEHL